jgi:outer membrane scaffolding protein for murein synthesis (MipA/OmpV family)
LRIRNAGLRRGGRSIAAVLLSAACLPAAADATREPLWEFGLGVGVLTFQDYRGADSTHVYPVPVPYFVYNGKFFKADHDGVRGRLFNRDDIELNLSVNATTPVRSNRARNGMPDLKSTVEFGGSLDWHLYKSDDRRVKFDLRMPLRVAYTVEARPRAIGYIFEPRFTVDVANLAGIQGLNLGMLTGPLFADRRYNDYFYTVAPQFATALRPAYQARGGYSGTEFIASLSKRYPPYWVGAYVRYDTLAGAAFAASPLVQINRYWSSGIGIAWMIGKSARFGSN